MLVAFITGDGNYTRLHYSTEKQNLLAITLGKVIIRYPHLVRVSKHAAINYDFVANWEQITKCLFITLNLMGSRTVIKVSRRNEVQVKKELTIQNAML
ncbi:hypothetical protein CWM47_06270 [Spirosoma pollinicola]|uniref:HTH LytTR-type domain-containing protein n=1 Tax=Spirosoma pollinicola TaxID=2057025 RepID=A0A2K8YUZ0_9BACT|nr:hypothetical protein CWM47_06270 [Spirosoma pollinicola]